MSETGKVVMAGWRTSPALLGSTSGLSGTRIFEDADGNVHTVIIAAGLIQSWGVTVSGAVGQWHFNQAAQSGQVLTAGF